MRIYAIVIIYVNFLYDNENNISSYKTMLRLFLFLTGQKKFFAYIRFFIARIEKYFKRYRNYTTLLKKIQL